MLAPPGCGKTDILTERVVHAHDTGVDYSKMLCLTFTNRAAKGMAQRIADRTGNPVPDDLFVGNIHRFCSQTLFNHGVVNHNCAIIDEGDMDNIIQEDLCKQLNIKSGTTELMRYQHALWQLTLGMRGEVILHGDLLHIGAMTKLCDVLGRPATEDSLTEIYADIEGLFSRHAVLQELPAASTMRLAHAYQRYKEENDLLDYDDLLVLAYQYLSEKSNSGAMEPERYSWIQVDEVQDLNPLQLALIDLFTSDDATIVYLGDEQQAIFSFIGAKLETLEALKRRCAGHIHHLHTNYRSPRYLLDLQNDYAIRNLGIGRNLLPHTDDNTEASTGDLCLVDVVDARMESHYAARLAKRYGDMLENAGTAESNGKVAILVSTNREADEVGDAMTALGVPHFRISGTDLFSLPTVRLLLAHLSVMCDETVFIAWARILWGLGITSTYTAARTLMRQMRACALLPTDFLLYDDSTYLQQFVEAYQNEDLIIFDTETTGLDPETDDIIQIAAIRVRQGRQVGKPFNIVLETERELPATVGGHPNPMLEVYKTSKRHSRAEGLRMFMDYCKGRTLVGHNVRFDYTILSHNMRRDCPEMVLEQLCPRYFDTLKYIRLVRPRLRHYKLVNLIETLHLEGQNSHRADDDILATLSLLRYCHTVATQLVAEQSLFATKHRKQLDLFRNRYAPLYCGASPQQGIADELERVYNQLVGQSLAAPVDKWNHLINYIRNDMVRADIYPTLQKQLDRYVTDLCTTKEADLCSGSLEERYIISTVHKAKGLEFDSVVIYRAIDGNYPGAHSWTERQIQEDARRLFVAISRSRKRLCILYDDYYARSIHTLSPFLEKVKDHFTLYRRGSDGKIRQV